MQVGTHTRHAARSAACGADNRRNNECAKQYIRPSTFRPVVRKRILSLATLSFPSAAGMRAHSNNVASAVHSRTCWSCWRGRVSVRFACFIQTVHRIILNAAQC